MPTTPNSRAGDDSRARTLADIPKVLSPTHLRGDQLDAFYYDKTDKARDRRQPTQRTLRDAIGPPSSTTKVLFIGHRGSGKSTEVERFQREHSGDWTYVKLSPLDEGLISPNVPDLFILIADRFVGMAREFKIPLHASTLDNFRDWFDEVTVERTASEQSGHEAADRNDRKSLRKTSAGVEAKATAILPGVSFAASAEAGTGSLDETLRTAKSEIKTGTSRILKSVEKTPSKLSELQGKLIDLIKEFQLGADTAGKPRPLLVIEDLDKVGFSPVQAILLDNPALLSGLPCPAIVMAPIRLYSAPGSGILDNFFRRLRLPMIRVLDKSSEPVEQGIQVVMEVIRKRIDPESHLIDDDLLREVIIMTAGILRMTFDVLSDAATAAVYELEDGEAQGRENKIIKGDTNYALGKLRGRMLPTISLQGIDKSFIADNKLTVEGLHERLDYIHASGCVAGLPLPIDDVLLECQALVEYNGENYRCVHPILRGVLDARRQAKARTTGAEG